MKELSSTERSHALCSVLFVWTSLTTSYARTPLPPSHTRITRQTLNGESTKDSSMTSTTILATVRVLEKDQLMLHQLPTVLAQEAFRLLDQQEIVRQALVPQCVLRKSQDSVAFEVDQLCSEPRYSSPKQIQQQRTNEERTTEAFEHTSLLNSSLEPTRCLCPDKLAEKIGKASGWCDLGSRSDVCVLASSSLIFYKQN